MDFKRIRIEPSKAVVLEWTETTAAGTKARDLRTCPDPPSPGFVSALQALKAELLAWLDLPKNYGNEEAGGVVVYEAAMGEDGELRVKGYATLGFGGHAINTPQYLPAGPEGRGAGFYGSATSKKLEALVDRARGYLKGGEREQADLEL